MTRNRDTFTARIVDIQPSQLFLNEEKGEEVERQASEGKEMEPVAVWQHDGRLVALDGHTRLYHRFTRGDETIVVYAEDEGTFNADAYVMALKWCVDEGIESIKDLATRILDRESYQVAWIDKCQRELPPG